MSSKKEKNRYISRTFFFTLAVIFSSLGIQESAMAQEYPSDSGCKDLENPAANVAGWCVAIHRRKGNCLACHTMSVEPWPIGLPPGGNIGPPLVTIKKRYPDKQKLRDQVWDATVANPDSVMPPFGKHDILREQDIDNIVEFLFSI